MVEPLPDAAPAQPGQDLGAMPARRLESELGCAGFRSGRAVLGEPERQAGLGQLADDRGGSSPARASAVRIPVSSMPAP